MIPPHTTPHNAQDGVSNDPQAAWPILVAALGAPAALMGAGAGGGSGGGGGSGPLGGGGRGDWGGEGHHGKGGQPSAFEEIRLLMLRGLLLILAGESAASQHVRRILLTVVLAASRLGGSVTRRLPVWDHSTEEGAPRSQQLDHVRPVSIVSATEADEDFLELPMPPVPHDQVRPRVTALKLQSNRFELFHIYTWDLLNFRCDCSQCREASQQRQLWQLWHYFARCLALGPETVLGTPHSVPLGVSNSWWMDCLLATPPQ